MKIQDHVERTAQFGLSAFTCGIAAHKLIHAGRLDGHDAPAVELVKENFDQIAIRDEAGEFITMIRFAD